MKKFLLVFISILTFSFLLVNNKTYAQEVPEVIIKTSYNSMSRQPDNQYTYEFTVYYIINGDYTNITLNDYYFITNAYIPIARGYSAISNSYEITNINYFEDSNYTIFNLNITLLKDLVDEEYGFNPESPNYIANFFSEAVFYVKYIYIEDEYYDIGYNAGYDEGYSQGLGDGRIEGYYEGSQVGYRQGYENGYNHDNRIKIPLWQYNNIYLNVLDTVYRFDYNQFVLTYGIISSQGLTTEQIKNKIFIPTFTGFLGSINTNVRQWVLDVSNLYLSVEKSIIETIMTRDSVDEITALKTYLQENNIYGYFERADGKTKYQLGYDDGEQDGYFWGHEEGYDEGYDIGYDLGFDVGKIAGDREGYDRGYEEGVAVCFDVGHEAGWNEAMDTVLVKFTDRIHIWLIPAIILVFIIGIFIAYRKRRE